MTGQGSSTKAPGVVLAVLVALVVVALAVVIPLVLGGNDDDSDEASDDGSTPASAGTSSTVDTSNLDLVEERELPGGVHVAPGQDVDYPQTPPVGGEHWGDWLECGVYDAPVPDEAAVHDLEHGSVWITYREDQVDSDGVDRLAAQLPANGIMSPHADQGAPVVITVWGRQLELTGPDDPRIALFIGEYGAGETSPEPFASCAGGTADPADPGGSV